tara:strand:+ start:5334 stop:6194 length:861 start_codon:yes stop_codon:yes gene_type:complete
MSTVWIIDDDKSIRWVLEKALDQANIQTRVFEQAEPALNQLKREQPDAIITDIRMPGMDGLMLLEQVHEANPDLPVIIMTAHSDLESAVSSYRRGAFEYLPKPFDVDEAVSLIERAIAHFEEMSANTPAPEKEINEHEIIGEAPAMQEVFRAIGRLSHSHITVLINGESGTGKELVAHALHKHSPRAVEPFIALNMAAIPRDLIESELFGHEKAPLPVLAVNAGAVLSRLTAVPCSWMKLAICHPKPRPACCAYWPMANFIGLAVPRRSTSMYVLSPPPTRTSKAW